MSTWVINFRALILLAHLQNLARTVCASTHTPASRACVRRASCVNGQRVSNFNYVIAVHIFLSI